MFEKYVRDGKFLGFSLKHEDRFYFFGSRHTTRADLPRIFPHYEFCFLKQVHGRAVVEGNPTKTFEADAHFTNQPRRALVSQSADCVPILLSAGDRVCAIHAGWRGLAQNIVAATPSHLPAVATFAAIGPHIQQKSFEVGEDVARTLQSATPAGSPVFSTSVANGKCFFDLNALARVQLRATFGRTLEIADVSTDTKTDSEFHSYRRGKELAQRQYSFIVIDR